MTAVRLRLGVLLPIIAALGLASCQQLALPEQGFVTRKVGSIGGLLRDTFEPLSDFDGRPLPSVNGTPSFSSNGNIDQCEITARSRAHDVEMEGFDDALQDRVYAFTLNDCRAWASRH